MEIGTKLLQKKIPCQKLRPLLPRQKQLNIPRMKSGKPVHQETISRIAKWTKPQSLQHQESYVLHRRKHQKASKKLGQSQPIGTVKKIELRWGKSWKFHHHLGARIDRQTKKQDYQAWWQNPKRNFGYCYDWGNWTRIWRKWGPRKIVRSVLGRRSSHDTDDDSEQFSDYVDDDHEVSLTF